MPKAQTVLSFEPKEDERNISHYRRENSFWKELALINLDSGTQYASVRFYGAKSTVYCVAWIWPLNTRSARGYGKAGGYGYHKASAAMGEAFKAAGIDLKNDIGGVGDEAMKSALMALAEHIGISRPFIYDAHA